MIVALESPAVAIKADNRSSNRVPISSSIKYAGDIIFLDCSDLVVEEQHSAGYKNIN